LPVSSLLLVLPAATGAELAAAVLVVAAEAVPVGACQMVCVGVVVRT